MKRFEIGKWYRANDCAFEPIQIIRRTPKCVVVKNWFGVEWRMVVKEDDKCEYVTDSTVPQKWRPAFTYCADNEADDVEVE